jgi:exonuclease III
VGVLIKRCKDIEFEDPDALDPRMMVLNLEIKGFKIRLVNVYAHINCDGQDNQKYIFYRSLKKACIKQHKHQKILVCGDFNATTSVSLKHSCFNGQITDDHVCNDNGIRLKRFVRETGYCMTQTYFNHPEEERYTWFSGDKTTKKVLDYVIVEHFIQHYVNECEVDTKFECDSDHRIVITTLLTPTTKRARWKPKLPKSTGKVDVKGNKALQITFLNTVKEEMKKPIHNSTNQPEKISANIVTILKTAAESTLPKL